MSNAARWSPREEARCAQVAADWSNVTGSRPLAGGVQTSLPKSLPKLLMVLPGTLLRPPCSSGTTSERYPVALAVSGFNGTNVTKQNPQSTPPRPLQHRKTNIPLLAATTEKKKVETHLKPDKKNRGSSFMLPEALVFKALMEAGRVFTPAIAGSALCHFLHLLHYPGGSTGVLKVASRSQRTAVRDLIYV